DQLTPQPSLLLIGLAISLGAGFVFGVMPLRQIFKTEPNVAIKSGGIQFSAGRRWALRDVLLAAQIAFCFVTLTPGVSPKPDREELAGWYLLSVSPSPSTLSVGKCRVSGKREPGMRRGAPQGYQSFR